MHVHRIILLLALFVPPRCVAGATEPVQTTAGEDVVVLVHGFMGWGPGEVTSPNGTEITYWGMGPRGGSTDIARMLAADSGVRVVQATVSPILSDRQRAVQLYAQLTGTTADFGARSAAVNGHARYGVRYRPLAVDTFGRPAFCRDGIRFHLLGHSQGGTTARVLASLLSYGDASERAYPQPNPSPLFGGGQGRCLASVSTISSPHDGTPLASTIEGHVPPLQQIFVWLAALVEGARFTDYGFDVEHWGIVRQPNQPFADYVAAVQSSALWHSSETALASLTVAGAEAQNARYADNPAIRYYAWTTERTEPRRSDGCHQPQAGMTALLKPAAALIGCTVSVRLPYGKPADWWENDGLVSAVAQSGPGTPAGRQPLWTPAGTLLWDHGQVVGLGVDGTELEAFYEQALDLMLHGL